jgi:hypothetical protein
VKVDFLIAGVQKAGTSSLDGYLRQHPRIGMAEVKETHFFDNEAEFAAETVDYENYHHFFRQRDAVRCYGEATPIYTYWPESLLRIQQYNPQMKLVVLLRNPIERAWSAWRMEKRRGTEPLSFSAAIRTEAERIRQEAPLRHREFSYVDRGLYSDQIRRAMSHFSGQVLFLKSESFFSRAAEVVSQVVAFLDLPQHPIDVSTIHFQGEPEIPPDKGDRDYLLDRFRDEIMQVEDLLQWDCSDWLGT